jgi:formate hydrogenlyase subunit 3/multisubunit Na+/H+ antiporter MnhD subunit
MTTLLLLVVFLPAFLALGVSLSGRFGALIRSLAPWAPLPALLVALSGRKIPPQLVPWMLDGSIFGLDLTGQVFLFFTALLWTIAGVFGFHYLADDPRRHRFLLFHLLALTGNLGLIVSHDVVTFYLFFALMTFSGYGLVVHTRTKEAFRAGGVYLVMAVLGEGMLIIGLILAAASAGSIALAEVSIAIAAAPQRDLIIALILAGFGIKAGALPLHVWLPLAHPVAPTPASAVLSGSMIKAGLLGWLRFLPLGVVALEQWGTVVIVLGVAAALFGVVVGVTQSDPKTTLAYSSISQMGIINVAVGIGLSNPAAWPAALSACLAYATHHGLAKGALFLGTGLAPLAATVRQKRLVLAGLAAAGLAVAGAPLTSGAVAKGYLKDVVTASPGMWPEVLDLLLPLTAVGTTLLISRFIVLIWRSQSAAGERSAHGESRPSPLLWISWSLLLVAIALVLWIVPYRYELDAAPPTLPYPAAFWISIWPVIAGLLLAWIVVLVARRRIVDPRRLTIAPGDLLIPVEAVIRRAATALRREPDDLPSPVVSLASRWYGIYESSHRSDRAIRTEMAITRWRIAALLFLAMILLLVVMLLIGATR